MGFVAFINSLDTAAQTPVEGVLFGGKVVSRKIGVDHNGISDRLMQFHQLFIHTRFFQIIRRGFIRHDRVFFLR